MTSQPEAALPEAWARWEQAHKALFDVPLMRLEQAYAYKQDELNYASTELIALQAARIASLERENAAAVAAIEQRIAEYEARIKRKEDSLNEEYDPDLAYDIAISEAVCDGMDVALRHLVHAAQAPADAADERGVTP